MLSLTIFGRLSLVDSNGVEIPLKSQKAKALLAYLALSSDKTRSREEIMALLWSDRGETQARASLRQMLFGLKQELNEQSSDTLLITSETISLNPKHIIVETPKAGEELLSGFHLNDPAFDEWLRDERLSTEGEVSPSAKPTAPVASDKPSIAVLPFTNMSRDPDQEYFSDGITEDIITELGRVDSLFVIAPNSSFVFKGQNVETNEIAEKLGVQFVVLGSVQKSGQRVRISVKLVEVETGKHLWTEKYDREIEDIFEIQDEVASSVATMVSGHLDIIDIVKAERKHPKDVKAYDLVCRADRLFYQDYTDEEGARLLEEALKIDPTYAQAHAKLTTHYAYRLFSDALKPEDVLPLVKKHGKAAAKYAPSDALVHAPLSEGFILIGEHALAKYHAEKALSLNPNGFLTLVHTAEAMAFLGDHETGLKLIEKAMLNDPFASESFRENVVDIFFLAGRYEDALDQTLGWPDPPHHVILSKAAILGHLDRISEAKEAVEEFEAGRPEGWDTAEVIRSYCRMCAIPEDAERWLDGFRKAGGLEVYMPDKSETFL